MAWSDEDINDAHRIILRDTIVEHSWKACDVRSDSTLNKALYVNSSTPSAIPLYRSSHSFVCKKAPVAVNIFTIHLMRFG